MAQFDVHRNPALKQNDVPFVVVVQSSIFDDYRRRVVVPLALKSNFGPICNARFQPSFTIKAKSVVLLPLDIGSVPSDKLGKPVASLAAQGDRIIAALDELITRVYD